MILIAQGGPTCLGLGSSGHVEPNPFVPAQPFDSTLQSDPSQESVKIESSCQAPRASAIKEQDFSEAVAARIEAPKSLNQISL